MLVEELKRDVVISRYIVDKCCENDYGVSIDASIPRDAYVIIKIDDYYNKNIPDPPKSPDCLIVLRCMDGTYNVLVVELKNAQLATIKINDVREKFETCLHDFMSNRFRAIFYKKEYHLSLKLAFVTDPLNELKQPSTRTTTKLDMLMGLLPISFGGRKYMISHILPNPILRPC